MNKDILAGNWKKLVGKIKEEWGKLSEDDIAQINGKQDQLIGRLQERYGYNKLEAEKLVNQFYEKNRDQD